MSAKFAQIKVLVEHEYLVPLDGPDRTVINGWSPHEVVNDWFVRHNLNARHATRDAYEVGGAKQVKSIKVGVL